MSGIGWALGMERLLIALEAENGPLAEKPSLDAYVMCLDSEARTYAFEVVTQLRAYGFRSFKAQFKAVDRMKSRTAILIGNTEKDAQQVTIKNLKERSQETVSIDDLITKMDALLGEE